MRTRAAMSVLLTLAFMGLPGGLLVIAAGRAQVVAAWVVWLVWMAVIASRDPMARLGLVFSWIVLGIYFLILPESRIWGYLTAGLQVLLVYGAYRERLVRQTAAGMDLDLLARIRTKS